MKKIILMLTVVICASSSFAYYSSEEGRWLNRDPIEEQGGLNQYAFVANNPIVFYDIYGLRTYYIGGADEHDETYNQYDSRKQLEVFAEQVGADAFFQHNQVDRAVNDIENYLKDHPNENIVLIGHSWGGKSAMDISNDLAANHSCACITIITLDAVSLNGGPNKLPTNVDEWLNVHTPESRADKIVDVPVLGLAVQLPWAAGYLFTGNPDTIATAGNQWNSQDLASGNYPVQTGHMNVEEMIGIPLDRESSPPFTLKDYAEQVSSGNCEK